MPILMVFTQCAACHGMVFPGDPTCEDCQCPVTAAKPAVLKFRAAYRPAYLASLNAGAAPAVEKDDFAESWRAVGVDSAGTRKDVWHKHPINEKQAEEWAQWAIKRARKGKDPYVRVVIIDKSRGEPREVRVIER